MISGRLPIPGEEDRFGGHRDHVRYHSRIVRGRISSVSTPEDGVMDINTLELVGARTVTMPVLWFSVQGRKSAWGRYIPFANDAVHVEYRNDDTAVVVGYDAKVSKSSEGWDALTTMHDAGDVAGLATFNSLKSGEFDFKSAGDAYIYGTAAGTLFLAGGQAFLRLDKQNFKIDSKAGTYLYQTDATIQRFGVAYRKLLPSDFSESPVAQGIYHEFVVDVGNSISGVPTPASRAKLQFGDVLSELGSPAVSTTTGAPLAGVISVSDPTMSTESASLEIDQLGNVVWNLKNALGIIGFQINTQSFITLNAAESILLNTSLPVDPVVKGIELAAALAELDTIIQGAIIPTPVGPAVLSAATIALLTQWATQNVLAVPSPFWSTKVFTG